MTKQQFVMLANKVIVRVFSAGGSNDDITCTPTIEKKRLGYFNSGTIEVGLADGKSVKCKIRVSIVPEGQDDWEPHVYEWSKEVADKYISRFGSLPSGVVVK